MEQHYDLTYIISIKYLEDEMQKVMEEVTQNIKKFGGIITGDFILGKQKLAYPIKNSTQGTYVTVEFNLEGERLKELDNALKLMSQIIRHLIIKKRVKTAEEIKHENEAKDRLLKEKEVEKQKEEDEAKAKVQQAELVEEQPVKAVKAKKGKDGKDGKVSLDDLDKKLDEILKEDIL